MTEAASTPSLDTYLAQLAAREHSPCTYVRELLAEDPPQAPQVPVDPTRKHEAQEQLRGVVQEGVEAGVQPSMMLNCVLAFGTVMQRSGLTLEQMQPLVRHLAALWDEHDCGTSDAAIVCTLRQIHRDTTERGNGEQRVRV